MECQLGYLAKITNSMAMVTTNIINIFIISLLSIRRLIFINWFHGEQNSASTSDSDLGNEKRNSTQYCTVCLNDINGGEKYTRLPKCNHSFHVECIGKWFESSHTTCPLCRIEVPHQLSHQPHCQKYKLFFSYIFAHLLAKFCGPLDPQLASMICENMHCVT